MKSVVCSIGILQFIFNHFFFLSAVQRHRIRTNTNKMYSLNARDDVNINDDRVSSFPFFLLCPSVLPSDHLLLVRIIFFPITLNSKHSTFICVLSRPYNLTAPCAQCIIRSRKTVQATSNLEKFPSTRSLVSNLNRMLIYW